ncbi:response regulator [Ruegeria sediminis]|uniref:Response regulator n=1 Tax=Ruegeria sediminis TaxID=2583820 RepID=A0ABY2WV73_9RHOB|nr:response regulator [Ruegeria sediminis]TMV05621.1 response regulator [Ruegeria sediminis]
MRDEPLILVVDDQTDNRRILVARLESQGYATAEAADGAEALRKTRELLPDLILLDVMMPELDGFEVCRRIRADAGLPYIPIVLVTARTDLEDLVTGLDAGANDYLVKPVDHAALTARVRSALRVKALHDTVEEQRAELAGWNAALETKVADQMREIERAGRLRRYLPRQVAEQILAAGDGEDILGGRQTEVAVLFADLRGYTAYSDQYPPETVMAALNAFHRFAGPLIDRHGGTLERYLGDGLVVLFNAPIPCPDPVDRALNLARDMQQGFGPAIGRHQTADFGLGLGIGIAYGTATVGQIGFHGRQDYAAIGSVPNLAARLSDIAGQNQVLVSAATAQRAGQSHALKDLGERSLKGIAEPAAVFELVL